MSKAGKTALAAALVAGLLVLLVSQSTKRSPAATPQATATQVDREPEVEPEPPPPRKSPCEIEHAAIAALLPPVGETIDVQSALTTTQYTSKCYTNGFGVLIQVAHLPTRKGNPRTNPGEMMAAWVKALMAEDHNPRILNRTLFIKVIYHYQTSPTGVTHYTLLAESRYSPNRDKISVQYSNLNERGTSPSDFW